MTFFDNPSSRKARKIKREFRLKVLAVALLPIFLSAWIFQRAFGYRRERRRMEWERRLHYPLFFLGVPALAAATLSICFGLFAWRESYRRQAVYATAAHEAINRKNYSLAALCYGRLVSLAPEATAFRYNLALAAEQIGDVDRSQSLMAGLAPRDRMGYPAAHLWLANRLLGAQPRPSHDQLKQAEAHLLRIRNHDPATADAADELLARTFAYAGRLQELLDDKRLAAVVETQPELQLLTAGAMRQAGRSDEAAATARKVTEYFRRRSENEPDDAERRRQLCECYRLSGNETSLATTLKQGATLHPDGPWGEQWAELAVARAVRIGDSSTAPKAEKSTARREAIQLLDRFGGSSARAQLLAGQMARLDGDVAEAERRYRSAMVELPAVRLELADLLQKADRGDEARRLREEYLTDCRNRTQRGRPFDDGERRLAAAVSLSLERYDEADAWLVDAGQTDDVRTMRAQIVAVRWDAERKRDPNSAHLAVLQRGWDVDPWNPTLLARMLSVARSDGPDGAEAQAELRRRIAVGELPAAAYLLLGTDAFERGDATTAMRYLEQAQRLHPASGTVLNNLAWSLLHAERPELDRALATAEAAVRLEPANAHLRDTRFRILAKLERWQQALVDLEFCATTMKGSPEFHRTAADVYDHLKLPDLAAEHRRLSQ